MGESEIPAEELNPETEESSVKLTYSEFLNLTTRAGITLEDDDLVAAVEETNFQ